MEQVDGRDVFLLDRFEGGSISDEDGRVHCNGLLCRKDAKRPGVRGNLLQNLRLLKVVCRLFLSIKTHIPEEISHEEKDEEALYPSFPSIFNANPNNEEEEGHIEEESLGIIEVHGEVIKVREIDPSPFQKIKDPLVTDDKEKEKEPRKERQEDGEIL